MMRCTIAVCTEIMYHVSVVIITIKVILIAVVLVMM